MARITVEDCLKRIDNQFDLVMTAAKRARRLANGAEPLVELEDDKPTVVALREIAEGLINDEILADMDEPVEDILSSEEAEELLANTPVPGMSDMPAAPVKAPGFGTATAPVKEAAALEQAPPAPAVEIPAVEAPAVEVPAAAAAPAQEAAAEPSDDAVADAIAAELAAAMNAPAQEAAPAAPAEDAPTGDEDPNKPEA